MPMERKCGAASLCLAFLCAVLLTLLSAGIPLAWADGLNGGAYQEYGKLPVWLPQGSPAQAEHLERPDKAGAWQTPLPQNTAPHGQCTPAKSEAEHFFRQAERRGLLSSDDAQRYSPALKGLPWLEDALSWLLEHPSGMRLALDALISKKRTLIGPFVYYSPIRNYEKIMLRHVDLRPVIQKIASGRLRPDTADGWKIFNNYERRLPPKKRGYYHEVRVPTERLRGPGPQRLVYGDDGEIYYTSDHYETFQRLEVSYK